MKNLLFIISILTTNLTLAKESSKIVNSSVNRIQSMRFNKAKVERIYLAPGLGSILLFPCSLQEVFLGRSDDIKAQISPNDRKTLFLNLKLNSSLPTNLIAKCFPEKNIFIFDIIPNKQKHQDLVEIRSSFGRPLSTEFRKENIQISEPKKIVIKRPVQVLNK